MYVCVCQGVFSSAQTLCSAEEAVSRAGAVDSSCQVNAFVCIIDPEERACAGGGGGRESESERHQKTRRECVCERESVCV